jgi:integrase
VEAGQAGCRPRRSQAQNDPHGINISEISPHTLRRQYATWMLGRGVRVEALAAALGHSSPTITMQSYAAWNQEKLMAELMVHSSGGLRKTRNPEGSA